MSSIVLLGKQRTEGKGKALCHLTIDMVLRFDDLSDDDAAVSSDCFQSMRSQWQENTAQSALLHEFLLALALNNTVYTCKADKQTRLEGTSPDECVRTHMRRLVTVVPGFCALFKSRWRRAAGARSF